jgi:hypothetical protein
VGEVEPRLGLVRAETSAGLEGGQAVEYRPGDFRAHAGVRIFASTLHVLDRCRVPHRHIRGIVRVVVSYVERRPRGDVRHARRRVERELLESVGRLRSELIRCLELSVIRLTTITLGSATLPVGQVLVGADRAPRSPGCWMLTNTVWSPARLPGSLTETALSNCFT